MGLHPSRKSSCWAVEAEASLGPSVGSRPSPIRQNSCSSSHPAGGAGAGAGAGAGVGSRDRGQGSAAGSGSGCDAMDRCFERCCCNIVVELRLNGNYKNDTLTLWFLNLICSNIQII